MTLLMNIINFLMTNDIITYLYFGLLGLLLVSTNVSKYLKTHKLESMVLVLTTVMMVLMTYFKVFNSEKFKNKRDKCCPPKGITPTVDRECEDSTFKKCSDGQKEHVVGKFVRGGKYRCMGDGRAYKC